MLRPAAAVLLFASSLFSQGNHLVTVACCAFTDSTSGTNVTTVPAGTTVQWMLSGFISHTVTSGTGSTAPNVGALFDQPLNSIAPVFIFTFTTPGVVPYFCRVHENFGMNGTVVVTTPASVTSTGSGCAGSSGQPLLFAANGLPHIGNASFSVSVSGGPAGASLFIFVAAGIAPSPLAVTPTCFLYLDLGSTLQLVQSGQSPLGPFPLGPAGSLTLPFAIPNTNAIMGAHVAAECAAIDSGATSGVVTSNALTVIIGT